MSACFSTTRLRLVVSSLLLVMLLGSVVVADHHKGKAKKESCPSEFYHPYISLGGASKICKPSDQLQLVQDFIARFNDYWKTLNGTKIGSLYDSYTSFVNFVNPAVVTYGRQNVSSMLQGFQNQFPQLTVSVLQYFSESV